MLAHELAHVVQQRNGQVQNPFGNGTALVQDQRLEAEAERMAQRVALQSAAQRQSVRQPKAVQPNGVQTKSVQPAITGWWSEVKKLYRVEPQFSTQPKQNCNDFSEQVTGAWTETRGGHAVLATVDRLLNEEGIDYRERGQDYIRVSCEAPNRLRNLGANLHARAGVGEAYMITSIGKPEPEEGDFAWIRDIRSDELRKIGWPYHFAGVVASSGDDTITLENYARGDNRKNSFNPAGTSRVWRQLRTVVSRTARRHPAVRQRAHRRGAAGRRGNAEPRPGPPADHAHIGPRFANARERRSGRRQCALAARASVAASSHPRGWRYSVRPSSTEKLCWASHSRASPSRASFL
jgi:hypothetical protein